MSADFACGHTFYQLLGFWQSRNMSCANAKDTMTFCDPLGQSLSPMTPVAAADLREISSSLVLGIKHILASSYAFLLNRIPPLSLGRLMQPVFHADTGGIEGEKTIKRRWVGSKSAIPCENYVGNRVPLQSNIPVRPKELTRDDTLRMLMDKARAEITRYLND